MSLKFYPHTTAAVNLDKFLMMAKESSVKVNSLSFAKWKIKGLGIPLQSYVKWLHTGIWLSEVDFYFFWKKHQYFFFLREKCSCLSVFVVQMKLTILHNYAYMILIWINKFKTLKLCILYFHNSWLWIFISLFIFDNVVTLTCTHDGEI